MRIRVVDSTNTPAGNVPMSPDVRLSLVLDRWLELRQRGEEIPVEELCRECPDLIAEVSRLLAVFRRMTRLRRGPADSGTLGPEQSSNDSQTARWGSRAPLPKTSDVVSTPTGPGEQQVPGYLLMGELGRGGMGVVYKARQLGLERVVALKMILHADYAGDDSRQRFAVEARAAAALDHPNIVQVHDIGEHGGLPYFSLEYCSAGSLSDKLSGTPWEAHRAAALIEILARAAHVAHQEKIVHRDLKPANVMFTADGTPKITDFGLAKRLDDNDHTAAGTIVGTPSYMAPEQARGLGNIVGPHTDVYALGAILYELLTGRPPFRAANQVDTILQVIGNDPAPPRQLNPKVPKDLETICLKCLQKEPTKRYASGLALAEDLQRFNSGEPIVARPIGPVERGVKWIKRNPVVAALLTALLLVLPTAFVVVVIQLNRVQRALAQTEKARTQRARALVDSLVKAGPKDAESILLQLHQDEAEVHERLLDLWEALDAPADHAGRMRIGLALALGGSREVIGPLTDWMLEADDPAEVLLVRDILKREVPDLGEKLWPRVAESKGLKRLRLLAALAAFDPENSRWATVGPTVIEPLVSANPLHLGTWVKALAPVSRHLVGPLGEVFAGRLLPGKREVATIILSDYARDDPDRLADLLMQADNKGFVALWPLVKKHQQRVKSRFKHQLGQTLAGNWGDEPIQPTWATPPPSAVKAIEKAHGLIAERFAFCQTLPLAELKTVTAALKPSRYRPSRVRLYHTKDGVRAAVVWQRDSRDWILETGLTPDEVKQRDKERSKRLMILDVSGILVNGQVRYSALWIEPRGGEQTRLYIHVPEEQHIKAYVPFRNDRFQPWTINGVNDAEGKVRLSGVWGKYTTGWRVAWNVMPSYFSGDYLGHVSNDVSLALRTLEDKGRRMEIGAWLATPGQIPWLGLAMRHADQEASPLRLALTFSDGVNFQDQRLINLEPEAMLKRARELMKQGYRPKSFSTLEILDPTGKPRLTSGAVWLRTLPGVGEEETRDIRQATALIGLARLGEPGSLWKALQHTADPQKRSYLIAWMAARGLKAGAVFAQLDKENDLSTRRALVLSLGEYDDKQLPPALIKRWIPKLLGWYRTETDPGLRSALDWLLRPEKEGLTPRLFVWGQHQALEKIDKDLSQRSQAKAVPVAGKDPTISVNTRGQTFAVIPGPVEFMMGSPTRHLRREYETVHRRRIDRSFALSTRPVTNRQFDEFIKANPDLKIYPTRTTSADPDGPILGITWYEAAQYCRWLSEQEGIPEDQMCYPSLTEIESCKLGRKPLKLPANLLDRTGYRLPTDGEWEYACGARSTGKRFFGTSTNLLGRYGWYRDNTPGRWVGPAGQKRPNDLGMFDMLGPVNEFMTNWYVTPRLSPGRPVLDRDLPPALIDQIPMVVRGANIGSSAEELRTSARRGYRPTQRFASTGFRLARTCLGSGQQK